MHASCRAWMRSVALPSHELSRPSLHSGGVLLTTRRSSLPELLRPATRRVCSLRSVGSRALWPKFVEATSQPLLHISPLQISVTADERMFIHQRRIAVMMDELQARVMGCCEGRCIAL